MRSLKYETLKKPPMEIFLCLVVFIFEAFPKQIIKNRNRESKQVSE